MNRPEPIELENNLGPDAVTGEINRVPWMAYDVDEMDIYIAEKDKEIAELKKKLMPCLNGDCILTCEVVEKYGKENAELKQELSEKDKDIAYWREEYDKETQLTDALKAEIESLKASHYAEMVDAGMRERRLHRALWLARAERAKEKQQLFHFSLGYEKLCIDGFYDPYSGRRELSPKQWIKVFNNVEVKCLKKGEEYR